MDPVSFGMSNAKLADMSNYSKAKNKLYFKKNGNDIWLRTAFNDTNDLVQKLYANMATKYATVYWNPIFCPNRTSLLAKNTALDYATSWDGTTYHYTDDDAYPLNYNGTYMGGNHGPNCCRNVTITGHDKATADLGSIWQDAGTKQWTLVRIVDANTLQFCPEFTVSSDSWAFSTTIGAAPLSHVSGATHTGDIAFTASVVSELLPCVKTVVTTILKDGVTDISVDGIDAMTSNVFECDFIDIKQTYSIPDPRTIPTYMQANVGKTIAEAIVDSSVTADVNVAITYRFYSNGTCVVYHTVTAVNKVNTVLFGGVQSIALNYGTASRKLLEYIPRAKSFVGSTATWDFKTPSLISGTFEEINLTSARWEDANKPPFRFTQVLEASDDTKLIGFTLGYSLDKTITIDSVRKNNLAGLQGAFNMPASSRKQYPVAEYATSLSAAAYINALCYRSYFDPNGIQGATVFEYHQEGESLIVDIDFNQTVSDITFELPSGWYGKTVTILDSAGTITVSNTVGLDGITVSVTDYGSATLKIG
jgi:hypothetical protein